MAGGLLLLRFGAIGDALLAFPALLALRRTAPGRSVTLAAHPAVGPLASRAGLVDRFLSRDAPELGALFAAEPTAARAALGRWDGACAWSADPDGVLSRNLRAIAAGPVVVQPSQPAAHDPRHVGQYLLDCLAPFGVSGSASDLWDPARLRLPSAPESAAGERAPLVVIHPGSGSRRKNWPLERFEQLGRTMHQRLAARLTMLLGPAELAAAGSGRLEPGPWDLLVERPLLEVAALLARCDQFVGNDSGLAHLAGLCGAPTLALFGPTDPTRWRPLGPDVTVIWREPLERLAVSEVLATVIGRLEGGGPGRPGPGAR
jgi:ADP-heptose:LPS heptosyltransferase